MGLDPTSNTLLQLAPTKVMPAAETEVDCNTVITPSPHGPTPTCGATKQLDAETKLQRSLYSFGDFKGADRPQKTPLSSDPHLSAKFCSGAEHEYI